MRTASSAPTRTIPQLTVAAVTMTCDGDPAVNLASMTARIDEIVAAHPAVDLILFGEMILGRYAPSPDDPYMRTIAETVPGPATHALAEVARERGVYLSFGLAEACDGPLYNTQVLLGPDGEVVSVHRKWNLKPAELAGGFSSGSRPVTICEIEGLRVGTIICADGAHPRTWREILTNDVDLLLYSVADDRDEEWFLAKTNAMLYQTWIAVANRFGREGWDWHGHMAISDPNGALRQTSVGREGYLVQTMDWPTRPWLRRALTTLRLKASLLWHVARNWRTLQSYYR